MTQRQHCGVPEGSPEIEVDGVRIAVVREGRGPALVCLHAIGHGARDFDAFAAAVRDRYEVIRVDWPGQGRSGADAQPPSAARYAQLLARLLERLDVRAPILVGNSIGGAAALLYAQRQPVRALVLCDPGGLVAVDGFVRLICRMFAAFFAAGERGAAWFARAFRFYYRFIVLPGRAATDQRERIIRAGVETAPILCQAWTSFAQPQADLRALAAALDVPIWCAWARSDRVIPLLLCRPAIRRMKHATLTTFSGGHSAFLEQPVEFAVAFDRFVARSVTAVVAANRGLQARDRTRPATF
ncbi:MAG: alpha/beta hydrolase [Sinimarinibacterium sp.]|jgi:4,5:9,10-diseco-3-hydroxy-5,9,17-trioxoandrosta-1(10),2-diene-4-oate hydrolase